MTINQNIIIIIMNHEQPSSEYRKNIYCVLGYFYSILLSIILNCRTGVDTTLVIGWFRPVQPLKTFMIKAFIKEGRNMTYL